MTTYIGSKISYTIFGGSHEKEIGIEATGLPYGEEISFSDLDAFLKRRAPGQNEWSTPRKEPDVPLFTSGFDKNRLNGEKLRACIQNKNMHSADYCLEIPRPSHADYTAHVKYGNKINMAGGGPFSGRMTAPLCILGNICLQILESKGIYIAAHITRIGSVCAQNFNTDASLTSTHTVQIKKDIEPLLKIKNYDFPALTEKAQEQMKAEIAHYKSKNDSIGGIIECLAFGLPAGLGGPMTDGLESRISSIVFGIPAVRGIEFGAGFEAASMCGSNHNDAFQIDKEYIYTTSNNHGGILGGISSGMPLIFRTAFKPTPSIGIEQESVNLRTHKNTKFCIKGRHDPCIVPRAVPVIEAACAIALLDAYLEWEDEQNQ